MRAFALRVVLCLIVCIAGCSQPTWSMSGVGDSLFVIPDRVSSVRITGDYRGSCQNFIVHIQGRLIVNEILGTCSVASGLHYQGTHDTEAGATSISNSSGVSWSFTQVD